MALGCACFSLDRLRVCGIIGKCERHSEHIKSNNYEHPNNYSKRQKFLEFAICRLQGAGVRWTPNGSALGVHLCEAEAPTEATAETQILDLRICKAL